MEVTQARVEAYGSRAFAIDCPPLPGILALCALPTFGPSMADFCNDSNAGEPAPEKMGDGLHEHGGVLYHVHAPLEVSTNGMPRLYHMVSVLVPRPGGAISVEAVLAYSPVPSDPGLVERLTLNLTWMACGTADPAPVLQAMIEWGEASFRTELDELADALPPDVEMCAFLMCASQQAEVLQVQLQEARNSLANGLREQGTKHVREERRLSKQVQELRTQLETAQAVAARQRARADAAERRVREMGAAVLADGSSDGAVAQLQARLAEREAASAQTEHERDQYSAEVDRLKAEIYQLRDQLAYRAALPAQEEPEVPDAPMFPAKLSSIVTWSDQALAGRVTVHPKAARAARKSNFSDPALVYRVLQAMADHYWPMRFEGCAQARDAWTAFLTQERLSCTPTGDAAFDHRTADAYRVRWHGASVTLDLHIRGDSSRDEARGFRVYFHVDDARKVILIGHAPGHLPNTLS